MRPVIDHSLWRGEGDELVQLQLTTIEARLSDPRRVAEERIRTWEVRARAWAVEALPRLNRSISEDRAAVSDFVSEAQDAVFAHLAESDIDSLARCSRSQARRCLELLGFIACSIERHTQAHGLAPGAGLAQLPALEDALGNSGMAAELPPTLGYAGYWLDNSGTHPLTFTGDPQERFFREMVVRVNDLHSRAAALVRPIARGEIAVDSAEAVRRLLEAAEAEDQVHDCYRSFRPVGPAAREKFTVPFFTYVMRSFLVAFPVHGRTFHGPNAANISAQASLDYLGGIVEPFYRHHVEERMSYMSLEERLIVVEDMRTPSVLERLLDAVGLAPADVLTLSKTQISRKIAERRQVVSALTAFGEFKRAAGGAAGAHFGLIVHFLQREPKAGATSTPVAPSHGTGGRSHDETKQVMRMRQREPTSTALLAAVKSAASAMESCDGAR
jgi:Domain of unknown function (DUF1864)